MELTDLMTLIGNYAFPIVCCVGLFWKMNKDEEQHKAESDSFAAALHNNTIALTELREALRNGQK